MLRIALIGFLIQLRHGSAVSTCATGCTLSSVEFPFMCIDMATSLTVSHCTSGQSQAWTFKSNSYYLSGSSAKCLTVLGTPSTNQKVGMAACTGSSLQKWGVDSVGRISLGGKQSLCLAPLTQNFKPGSAVGLFPCTYYLDQSWRVVDGKGPPPVPKPNWNMAVNLISELDPTKCLDIPGADTQVGNYVDVWDCNGLFNQQWLLEAGTGQLSALANSSICIGTDTTPAQGSRLKLKECKSTLTRKFTYNAATATLTTVGGTATTCLDIPGANPTNGSKIWMWGCNTKLQQQWFVANAGYAKRQPFDLASISV